MSTNRPQPIYLDYAASSPTLSMVRKAMMPFLSLEFGNAGSLHSFGQRAVAAVDRVREVVAHAIGATFEQIVFTGSATEANNMVLRGAVKLARMKNMVRPRILVSSVEHDSVLQTAKDLEREGVEAIYLPVDSQGSVDLEVLEKSLTENTVLVSVMYVSNEIGTIQPIAEIGKIIKKFKEQTLLSKKSDGVTFPIFHTDAVQAFRYLDCDVKKLGVDAMTLSAHKIGGPKGVGALYTRIKLPALITGGGQESGMRSGTENVSGIAGLGAAVTEAVKNRVHNFKKVEKLKSSFASGLRAIGPDVQWNGPDWDAKEGGCFSPHILNVFFPAYLAEELLVKLDRVGIAASSGSACSARASRLSHVLAAIGRTTDQIQCSLRFSFGPELTPADIKEALQRIRSVL